MKRSKTKSCKKSTSHSTFSMIKFYESIPNYDEIGHLPDLDFTERVHLLKKVHYDLSKASVPKTSSAKRPKSRCKKKKCVKAKSATRKLCNGTPSTCDSLKNRTITESEERTTSSASQNSFGGGARPFCSIREKILADIEKFDRRFDELTPSSAALPFNYDHMRTSIPVPSLTGTSCEPTSLHHHHHHHCDPNYFHRSAYCLDGNRFTSPKTPCSGTPKAVTGKETKLERKSPPPSLETNLKRSKSCPKDLFRSTNDVTAENTKKAKPIKSCIRRLVRSNISPECMSHATLPCRKKSATKAKMPDAIDEFLTSKMVRSNLAANLRKQLSRKKITEMTDKRLTPPPPAQVTKYIPKCHRWNVRDTPAWKSFRLEDTTTEKILRQHARQEEDRLRHHAHTMNMNLMRSRVKSAQLLLEGRSLSAK